MENLSTREKRRAALAEFAPPAVALLAAVIALGALIFRWQGPSFVHGGVPLNVMVPATSLGVLFAAGALVLVRRSRPAPARFVGRLAACLALVLGVFTLARYAAAWGAAPGGEPVPGASWWVQLPGPVTGLSFTLLGISLLLLGTGARYARAWSNGAAAAALAVISAELVARAYGTTLYRGTPFWIGTAVPTAVALGAIALGILCANPSQGFAALFISESAGGRLLRRLIPVALVMPLLLGWLALAAQESGRLDAAFATALLDVSLILLLIVFIVRQAAALQVLDTERERLLAGERQAREQFNNILESITDAFFAVDGEWRFTYVNREAERLLRRSRDQLLGRELWTEFPAAVGSSFEREYRNAMMARKTVHFEEYYGPLGTWLDVRAYPAPGGLSIYFQDVTARRRTEEQIRESEARFRALAENATMAIFVIDEESRIEFANPAVERIFGYSVSEMVGRSLDMLMPEDQRPLHDVGMRRYRETGQRTITWEGIELPGLAKDGRVIPLEISMGEFVRGDRHYFTGIARDISERKEAEEALRESEQRYRLLVNMIPQHIWATEPDGYHSYFSQRWYEFTGATPEQTQGEGWLDLVHPADKGHAIERWENSLRTGKPYSVEYRFRGADGAYRWFMGQAVPHRNENGEIVRWFGTLTDISERKRLEEDRERLLREERQARAEAERRQLQLERMTESRARLIRGFSHDVRNPLGVADAQAWLLEDGRLLGKLSPKQWESIQRIRRSIRTSLQLIDDLLELAWAEAGQLEFDWIDTDVSEAAREVAEDFRAQMEAVGLALHIRSPANLRVRTDPARLQQILTNLLSNAVKYAPTGQITVSTELRDSGGPKPGEWLAVSVSDTGPGIPEDKQELIFQEYTRLGSAEQEGVGIGLAISRRLARLLGGDLTVESDPGRGATFTLWLPSAVRNDHAQLSDAERIGPA